MKFINLKKGQVHTQHDGTQFIAPHTGLFFDDTLYKITVPRGVAFNMDALARPGYLTTREWWQFSTNNNPDGEQQVPRTGAEASAPLLEYQTEINRISNDIVRNQLLFGNTTVRLNSDGTGEVLNPFEGDTNE
jgi:hypothetical protein